MNNSKNCCPYRDVVADQVFHSVDLLVIILRLFRGA